LPYAGEIGAETLTLEERVEFVDLGGDTQVDCLFAKVNKEPTEDRGVDLVPEI
jgi:hypothetical protein